MPLPQFDPFAKRGRRRGAPAAAEEEPPAPPSAVPAWEYAGPAQGWIPARCGPPARLAVTTLRACQYNCWYDGPAQQTRNRCLIDLITAHEPHLVALEEVNPATLSQILGDQRIQQRYLSSDSTGDTFAQIYGVVVLVDKLVASGVAFEVVPMPGSMKRSMVYTSFVLNDAVPVRFGAVHLESPTGGMSDLRSIHDQQLEYVLPILSKCPNAFLAGDFNFNAGEPVHWERRQITQCEYVDLWPAIHPDLPGHTLPEDVRHPATRIDHVIMNSAIMRPHEACILGDVPIGEHKGKDLFPSDHFGVCVSVRLDMVEASLDQDLNRIASTFNDC